MNWLKIAILRQLLKITRTMIFVFDEEKDNWNESDSILYDDLKALELKISSVLNDHAEELKSTTPTLEL